MAKKNWHYVSDARSHQTGLMICGSCGKTIDEGFYKYRDAGEKYITIHRACSMDDSQWQKLDESIHSQSREYLDFQSACKVFRKRWSHFIGCALDDYIDGDMP